MTDATDTTTVLLVDYPGRRVPDAFARAGFVTYVHGGPEPDNYSVHELQGEDVVVRDIGVPPDQIDLVYVYRPVEELADILAFAQARGARAAWLELEPGERPLVLDALNAAT